VILHFRSWHGEPPLVTQVYSERVLTFQVPLLPRGKLERTAGIELYTFRMSAPGSTASFRPSASDFRSTPITGHRPRCGWLLPWTILAQYFAGLPVDKVQLGAGETGDHLIFVFGHVWIVVQRMLDIHKCRRACEHDRRHRQNMTVLRR